mgnify:FL=1
MVARKNFENELEGLHNELSLMGVCVEKAIDDIFFFFLYQDIELITAIKNGDRVVDDMEKSIEAKCLSLITRQQPVARDLRVVSATLKVVTDIERIGDHAADIAEVALRCKDVNIYHVAEQMPALIMCAKQMVHEAVDIFIQRDEVNAQKIIDMDDEVDELFNQVKNNLVRSLKEEKIDADVLVDILMIAKYLERIGDHATNICEWSIFRETGSVDNVRLL